MIKHHDASLYPLDMRTTLTLDDDVGATLRQESRRTGLILQGDGEQVPTHRPQRQAGDEAAKEICGPRQEHGGSPAGHLARFHFRGA